MTKQKEYIYNNCHICGALIKVRRPKNPQIAKIVKRSRTAECPSCNPISGWKIAPPNEEPEQK